MAKYKFDSSLMGKQVIVTQILDREFKGNNRTWKSVNVVERRVGWMVGNSWVCNGVYDPGYSSRSYWGSDDEQPPYLKVTEKIPCLLITYWPSQKPIKVPVDGIILWDEYKIEHALLSPYCSAGYGSGEDRKRNIGYMISTMREESDNGFLHRDSKGRFISKKKKEKQ